jgi:transmembrane sensor
MGREETTRRALIEGEAAAWLARHDAGDVDVAAFERWRAADPAHASAFVQLAAAWSRLDRARALKPAGPPNPDLLAPVQAPSRRWLLRAAGVGGLTVLGAGGAAMLMTGRASAETGVGERRSVSLPDGSLLDLNTDSRTSWRFTGATRRVWLERGEAALEVARDAKGRPFVFAAAGREAPLQEGVFNARLRGRRVEIVALRTAGGQPAAAPLREGRALVLEPAAQTVRELTPAAAEAAGAWRRGEIVFEGDTLEAAVAEYNRYLTAKIEIGDPAISRLRVGGRFATRDPGEFLAAAEQAFGIRAAHAPDGRVVLSGG